MVREVLDVFDYFGVDRRLLLALRSSRLLLVLTLWLLRLGLGRLRLLILRGSWLTTRLLRWLTLVLSSLPCSKTPLLSNELGRPF